MTLRAPHFSRRVERKVQTPQLVPNLLVTTLIIAAAPFFTSELTQPHRLSTQQPNQVGSPLALIENAGEKPFAQYEWPVPPAIPTIQLEQVSKSIALIESAEKPFVQNLESALFGKLLSGTGETGRYPESGRGYSYAWYTDD